MTRDEILAAIERLSTEPAPSVPQMKYRMEEVAHLADTYMDSERWDNQYIAEALHTAMKRFAGHLLHLP